MPKLKFVSSFQITILKITRKKFVQFELKSVMYLYKQTKIYFLIFLINTDFKGTLMQI